MRQQNLTVATKYPVALDSPDHLYPWGTMHDNSTNAGFIADIEHHFSGELNFMDIGCSGGQLAVDFFNQGHVSVGLEGSDWSIQHQRANWVNYGNNVLFTCDAGKEFTVVDSNGDPVLFDCITAWEVNEHIHPDEMDTYLANIHEHLTDRGVFIGSVATFADDLREGEQVHQSVHSAEEWYVMFSDYFRSIEPISTNWVRDLGPSLGFHHCLVKR
jgi:2-polyprenyl-3-methyl-5-hydroxy-6-metoxy-1,4-benzoquinol methylase